MYTALAIPDHRWSSYLKGWLTWRRQLFRDHGVPSSYEIHAHDWLSSHPQDLKGADGESLQAQPRLLGTGRDLRRERHRLYEGALRVIGTFDEARLFTVETDSFRTFDLYAELLGWIDEWLTIEKAYGIVIIDGLDPGWNCRAKHRLLSIKTRRIVEDPQPCHSHESQLIQMADLCAHSAYRYVRGTDDPKSVALYRTSLARLHVVADGEASPGIRSFEAPNEDRPAR